ncbi:cysteinyl leukotriene receptor 1-like [Lineus longissimus]|uniref:cysteinyl leukotriene receptor 1-like n=1 Tax=Lineus longissimus TaxID=88925 RepID=UPI00315D88DB
MNLFDTTTAVLTDPPREAAILHSAAAILEAYIQPLIVVLGVVGNVISFRILSLPSYKHQSTCIYMKAMAFSDSMYLCCYVFQRTFMSIYNHEIRSSDNFKWICIQFLFWAYFGGLSSSIILQTMSLDRLFALLFPLKAKSWCSVNKARIFVGCMFLVLMVILLPLNLSRVYQPRLIGWLCPFHFENDMAASYDHFISIVGTYIPLVIIFISNVGIVVVLKMSEQRRQEMTSDRNSSSNNQVVRMLLVVSLTFLVLKLPVKIRNAFWTYYTGTNTPQIVALRRFTVTLSEVVEYCNFAFNTYIYILPVKKFREDAKTVCCCGDARTESTVSK